MNGPIYCKPCCGGLQRSVLQTAQHLAWQQTKPLGSNGAQGRQGCSNRWCQLALVGFFWLVPAKASAQETPIAAPAKVAAEEAIPADKRLLTLPMVTPAIEEKFKDFRKHCADQLWEQAFKLHQELHAANEVGLVVSKTNSDLAIDHLHTLRAEMLDLPNAAHEAFRLFYDAQAKQLLEQSQGEKEVIHLQQLAQQYYLTDAGLIAQDRLGDFAYQQGQFNQALEYWQRLLNSPVRTAVEVEPAAIVTKMAMAAFRSGQSQLCQQFTDRLRDEYSDANVTVAGESVSAMAFLDNWRAEQQPTPASETRLAEKEHLPNFNLPTTPKLTWRFEYLPAKLRAKLAKSNNNYYYNSSANQLLNHVPNVAIDETRLYVNYIGYLFALDRKTGKMLWRTDNWLKISSELNQNHYFQLGSDRYQIQARNGKIWCVNKSPQQLQNQEARFDLICWDSKTGAKLFGLAELPEFADWNCWSKPIFLDEDVYLLGASSSGNSEGRVVRISLNDRKVRWETNVGNLNLQNNYYYYQQPPKPQLCMVDNHLILDNDKGGMLGLSPSTGRIEWGYLYSDQINTDQEINYYNRAPEESLFNLVERDGRLFYKGYTSGYFFEFDPNALNIVWKRPADSNSVLLDVDAQHIYLVGKDLQCYERNTKQLLWQVRLPIQDSPQMPLVTADYFYVFARGRIFQFSRQNGQLVQKWVDYGVGRGGRLYFHDGQLFILSSTGICAYELNP